MENPWHPWSPLKEKNMKQTTRYSEADLAIFKAHIEQKLEKANEYLQQINEQVIDLQENKDSEGDWMDDTSSSNDLDMLLMMQNRQRKHTADLENALLRVRNKSYGICTVTGELIDKRRLMAVPSTSRSLEAKVAPPQVEKKEKPKSVKKTSPNQIISKVIKKNVPVAKPVDEDMDDDDDDDDLDLGEDFLLDDDELLEGGEGNDPIQVDDFDFDSIVDGDTVD